MVGLGDLPGGNNFSNSTGVSQDGTVVVGVSSSAPGNQEAFRWTEASGITGLGYLPTGDPISFAYGVSADGAVVIGVGIPGGAGTEGFRWTTSTGLVALGTAVQDAEAISADGNFIVGTGDGAVRWSVSTGAESLGVLPDGYNSGRPLGVSADGSVIVGTLETGSSTNFQAFRWSGGTYTGLSDLPGGFPTSEALGVSGDGSIVVGISSSADAEGYYQDEAFIWTATDGMRRLLDVLLANGAPGLDGWTLVRASAVSADGLWVVGTGTRPDGGTEAFLANIAPVPVPAVGWLLAPAFGLLEWVRRKATHTDNLGS